ncbi:unnamed protein product [Caenorhabditis auriculariae]|uniref:Cysteine synthase n=1 Tax=Caenorhabditis auriculariae TaxID=2777116 RepID=A0A8S1HRK1_9PELO|nr:unnamed protein product [Caenorhabditis auriculariae]
MSWSSSYVEQLNSYVEGLPTWGKAAVAGGAALALYLPYKYYTSRPRASPYNKDWQPDVVYLYQFPRTKLLPNISPFCLKVETWLRMNDVHYEVPAIPLNLRSKEGLLPFVELNGVEYYDSAFIIEELTILLKRQGFEEHLSEEQRAVSRAFECLAEKSLALSSFVTRIENAAEMIDQIDLRRFGFLLTFLKPFASRGYASLLATRLNNSELGPHSRADRLSIGADDLRAISKYLGQKHYFTGFKPTRVDACLFGTLAQIVFAPYETEHKTLLRTECSNLLEYVERIKNRFWPDWGDVTAKFSRDTNWKRRPRPVNGISTPNSSLTSPLGRKLHSWLPWETPKMSRETMVNSSCEVIGNTPLLRLNKITQGLEATIAVKLEYMNPTCSVKDRIALNMIKRAEEEGKISPGKTVLIEGTSGNLGISLAHYGKILGYKVILIMSDSYSVERRCLLKAYGAEVILTDAALGAKEVLSRAAELAKVVPNAHILDQFSNPANPEAHYKSTGPEIWRQTQGKVDIVCFGVGSSGTVTGVGRFLKEKNPEIEIYPIEPYESSVINGFPGGVHKIQGIGAGMVPDNLDRSLFKEALRVHSDDAIDMTRRLAKEESIFAGVSSGANVFGAMQLAKRPENKGKLIVTTVNSYGERYLSTNVYSAIPFTTKKMSRDLMVESGGQIIGNTPLLRLNKITQGLDATIAVKIEYMNPSCSVKDRIAFNMIEKAEQEGRITPGKTVLIEPTSGNMGIALAYCGKLKGYKVILTMPESMSVERRSLLKAYGAEVVLTDAALAVKGATDRAEELAKVIDNAYILNQFANPANPEAHYKTTGPEIWRQTEGKVDIVCFGVGSGGTVTGVGRYLKNQNPNVEVFPVEPFESSVINGLPHSPHKIQGMGTGMIPEVLDRSLFKEALRVHSDDAIAMARRLAAEESILAGISSGANVCAAVELAKRPENKGKLIVTTVNSYGERYLSTALYSTIREEAVDMKRTSLEESIQIARKYLEQ